jgi:small GTP-binding protein
VTIVKAVVLGDTECGKTSFTQRYTKGNFPDPSFLRTTIGASFDTKKVALPSSREATLSIWDFGGQLRFIEQMKAMIRGARVGLLFFDATRMQTLDNLVGYWIPAIEENSELRFHEDAGQRFIMVANKIDLLENERIDFVSEEMVAVAEPHGIPTHLLSAKTGIGLSSLEQKFLGIVDKFMD